MERDISWCFSHINSYIKYIRDVIGWDAHRSKYVTGMYGTICVCCAAIKKSFFFIAAQHALCTIHTIQNFTTNAIL